MLSFFIFLILIYIFNKQFTKIFGLNFILSLILIFQFIGLFFLEGKEVEISKYLFILSVSGLILGSLFAKITLQSINKKVKRIYQERNNLKIEISIWVLSFIVCLVSALFFIIKGVPILAENPGIAKIEFAKGGFQMRMLKVFVPILNLYFEYFFIRKSKVVYLYPILILNIMVFLVGYKGWVSFNIILLLMFYYYSYPSSFTFKKLLAFGVLSLSSFFISTFIIYSNLPIELRLIIALQRLTTDQVIGVTESVKIALNEGFRYMDTFSKDFYYLLGTLRLSKRPDTIYAVELYNRIYGNNPYNMTVPPGYIGEMFVNIGYIGVFIFSIIYAFIIHIIAEKIDRLSTKNIYLIFVLWMLIYMSFGGTIIGTITDYGISFIFYLTIYILIYLFIYPIIEVIKVTKNE